MWWAAALGAHLGQALSVYARAGDVGNAPAVRRERNAPGVRAGDHRDRRVVPTRNVDHVQDEPRPMVPSLSPATQNATRCPFADQANWSRRAATPISGIGIARQLQQRIRRVTCKATYHNAVPALPPSTQRSEVPQHPSANAGRGRRVRRTTPGSTCPSQGTTPKSCRCSARSVRRRAARDRAARRRRAQRQAGYPAAGGRKACDRKL